MAGQLTAPASAAPRIRVSSLILASLGFLLGGLAGFLLLDARVLDVRDVSPISLDRTTMQLGWHAFLRDPAWHFPITETDWLGYPDGANAALTDMIPLAALPLKLLDRIVPLGTPFQYLGWFAVLNFALMGAFGALLSRAAGATHWFELVAGTGLLLLSPVFLWRIGHTGLDAHWLLLAALLLYLRPSAPTAWKEAWPAGLLAAVAGLTHAYLLVMAVGILAARLASLAWRGSLRWPGVLLCGSVLAIGAILPPILIGLILANVQASPDPGFTLYSMNLLAPFSSNGLSSLFAGWPLHHPTQSEGFNYLGMGKLTLLAALLPAAWRHRRVIAGQRGLPLLVLCLVFSLVALSNQVTLGSSVLFSYPVPDILGRAIGAVRAVGRFFWPVGYALTLLLIALAVRLRPATGMALLASALAIQVADLVPVRFFGAGRPFRAAPDLHLSSPDWESAVQGAAVLMVEPPIQCAPSWTPGGAGGFQLLAPLVMRHGMKTNSYYAARLHRDEETRCQAGYDRIARGQFDADALYILSEQQFLSLRLSAGPHPSCRRLDGFILCRTAPLNRIGESLEPRILSLSEPVGPGPALMDALLSGWRPPDERAVWSGGQARLAFRTTGQAGAALDLEVAPDTGFAIRSGDWIRTVPAGPGGPATVILPPSSRADGMIIIDFIPAPKPAGNATAGRTRAFGLVGLRPVASP